MAPRRASMPIACSPSEPVSDPARTPARSLEFTRVLEWNDGRIRRVEDSLSAEEPLEIHVNGAPLTVTMRTPGHDLELAAGFLFTEGIADSLEEFETLTDAAPPGRRNLVQATLSPGIYDPGSGKRNFFTASSCGVCGKSSIESLRRRNLSPLNAGFTLNPVVLCALPDRIREQQAVFARTGGLHAAALFSASGELLVLREDIGRHNAVDKVIGWAMLEHRLPLSNHILVVSGRGGFEIVQKAIAGGVPVLACVSAPSSLAVRLAREMSLTLIGFLRGRRFVVYSGEQRCLAPRLLPTVRT